MPLQLNEETYKDEIDKIFVNSSKQPLIRYSTSVIPIHPFLTISNVQCNNHSDDEFNYALSAL